MRENRLWKTQIRGKFKVSIDGRETHQSQASGRDPLKLARRLTLDETPLDRNNIEKLPEWETKIETQRLNTTNTHEDEKLWL